MRSKRSAVARMIQQLRLNCVGCGAPAFYGSSRGTVCAEHKWSKRDDNSKGQKEASAKERRGFK
jgi:hypothetical protein